MLSWLLTRMGSHRLLSDHYTYTETTCPDDPLHLSHPKSDPTRKRGRRNLKWKRETRRQNQHGRAADRIHKQRESLARARRVRRQERCERRKQAKGVVDPSPKQEQEQEQEQPKLRPKLHRKLRLAAHRNKQREIEYLVDLFIAASIPEPQPGQEQQQQPGRSPKKPVLIWGSAEHPRLKKKKLYHLGDRPESNRVCNDPNVEASH